LTGDPVWYNDCMTTQELEEVKKVVRESMRESLLAIGINLDDPREAAENMAAIRDIREFARVAKRGAITSVVGVFVTAACTAIWLGIKSLVR
jgi:hypothetical protein